MLSDKLTFHSILDQWIHNEQNYENITHIHHRKPSNGNIKPFPDTLDLKLIDGLIKIGVESLYQHQIDCFNLVNHKKNVLLNTETASGKTLAFLLPIFNQFLIQNGHNNSLFLFPTKALAYDQYQQYNQINMSMNLDHKQLSDFLPKISVYDGDTPTSKRTTIRKNVNFLLSNPDMLHYAILPNHTRWENFFINLRYVIIDEVHIYRGVFGSHVANIIRRLKRVAKLYGSHLQFICTSATIGNAEQFTEKLIGEKLEVISKNDAPNGGKSIIFYNPPIENKNLGVRRSALSESIRIAHNFSEKSIQTLVFQLSRRSVELSLKISREKFHGDADEVQSYRSGYLAKDRRKLETDLRSEKIKILFSTNALELGMDIGGISNVILSGYPGSIASTLQQIGRSGRKYNKSSAIFIANDLPIDQYLIKRPEMFFIHSPENALLNPDNPLILLQHLRCALQEIMFFEGEIFGSLDWELIKPYLEAIVTEENAVQSQGKYYWISDYYPAGNTQIRSASGNNISLIDMDDQSVIGQIDYVSSFWMVHKDSIYMHLGEQYLVKDLDLKENKAYLVKNRSNYYTQPKRSTEVSIIESIFSETKGNVVLNFGNIEVDRKVTGFKEIHWDSKQTLADKDLDLPEINMKTEALWFVLSESIINNLRDADLWKSDINNYGSNWNKIKKIIRQRDFYKCQLCGLEENKSAHHVHHKIPFRLFESIDEANNFNNLITLCPSCHKKVEMNVRVRSGLNGLGYVLKNMSPIFLMCSLEDIDVYIDQKPNLYDGLPLCMLYDNIPYGIGLSQYMYQIFPDVLLELLKHVSTCPCQNGCPSCVGPGSENGLSGKEETIALLNQLVNQNG